MLIKSFKKFEKKNLLNISFELILDLFDLFSKYDNHKRCQKEVTSIQRKKGKFKSEESDFGEMNFKVNRIKLLNTKKLRTKRKIQITYLKSCGK